MIEVDRLFVQTEPKPKEGEVPYGRRFSDYFDQHIVVVLGEPGLGKTTSLRSACNKESNSIFLRIGEFLSAPNLTIYAGKTLYLDGLDEHRSKANGVDVIDALVGRLRELGSPKARISCRTAEWRHSTDVNALAEVSNGHPVFKLELLPLSSDDVVALLPEATDFISGAKARDLENLLENPQDLFLLYDFYRERNSWPHNRSELFEGACKVLLKELNKAHYEAIDDWVTDFELERTSDYLAAILLLSNVSGIAIERTSSNKAFPPIHEFSGNLFSMKAAAGRHVFKDAGDKRIEPKHRMIAEYMAARFLAARVREGLSLRRVMALLTGVDGGTPPDLRGVYAWLVTLLSGVAYRILVHDPYAALIYGDAYSWTPGMKQFALNALKEYAKKDPWFREEDISREALGGLSDNALVEDFQRILRHDDCQSHLVGTVLDAITGGRALPDIANDLLAFIRREDRPGHLKGSAIDAFVTAAPEQTDALVKILDEVNSGTLADEENYLRGALLRNLYPDYVGPSTIAEYLSKPSDAIIGWYHMFLLDELFEKSTFDDLRTIATSLQASEINSAERNQQFYYVRFLSGLVRRLIVHFGTNTSFAEMAGWLTLGVTDHGESLFRDDDAELIRDFFEKHEDIYLGLFLHYLTNGMAEQKQWHQVWWRFREAIARASPPYNFPKALVEELESRAPDSSISVAIFELACQLVMDQEPTQPSVSLETLTTVAKRSQKLSEAYERSSQCAVEEWRQRQAERKERETIERETQRGRNIKKLENIRDDIKKAKALGVLEFYARIWFGLFTDVDRDARPKTRVVTEVGEDIADDIIQGFKASLNSSNFNTLEEIAKTDADHKSFHRGYLLLAAMEVVAENGDDALLALPNDILSLAIAYNIANPVDAPCPWLGLIRSAKSELYECTLEKYWRVQIEANAERLSDFYTYNADDPRLPHIVRILPRLICDYPTLRSPLLEEALVNVVLYCSTEVISPLVEAALKKPFKDTTGQRTMWLSAGFAVAPSKYFRRLKKQINSDNRRKWSARKILLADLWRRGSGGRYLASVDKKKRVVELLGSAFSNVHFEARGKARFISDRDEPTAANEIRNLIHSFGADPSVEATNALSALFDNPALSAWKTDILYAMANQVRTAREARFTFPDVSSVVSTLSNAEPANVADLRALVLDALQEIADDLRHGNTDGWKSFWNTDSHGTPTNKHLSEEIARDRLLEHLRPKLRHLNIIAEPEVRYAEATRSDIAIYCKNMKLPIEIKRDDHSKIWVAAEDQLKKQYSRDPASEGNGIYLAFWFDGEQMKLPPKPHKKPQNSQDFEKTLRFLIPESSSGLIDVLVVDVSKPLTRASGQRKRQSKKGLSSMKSTTPKKAVKAKKAPNSKKAPTRKKIAR